LIYLFVYLVQGHREQKKITRKEKSSGRKPGRKIERRRPRNGREKNGAAGAVLAFAFCRPLLAWRRHCVDLGSN
jgi:hypothetical protein